VGRREEAAVSEHAEKAAAILREGKPLDPAERAAEKVIRDSKWILWHADDRDLGVIRLLHRAGLLRDLDREKEREEADASMRRIGERDRKADRILATRLSNLVSEAITALRDGRDPGQLADQIEAAYQRAQDAAEQERRGSGEPT
jgi:hypothetical protein